MTSYASKRRDEAVAADYLATHLPCRICGGHTPREDLSSYGARCAPCYGAWKAEANPRWMPNRPLTRDEVAKLRARVRAGLQRLASRPIDPKAWAVRLQEREQAGEILSRTQRAAWREALGVQA